MKLEFTFVPFPREIWERGIDLSQSEFRVLGWFLCNLKFGLAQVEVTDDQMLNGFAGERFKFPPLGMSRNSMQAARRGLMEKGMLIASQIGDGGGRGKSAAWRYSINLSEFERNPRKPLKTCEYTSQTLTKNPSDSERFPAAYKEEREKQKEQRIPEPSSGDAPARVDSKISLNPKARAERGIRMVLFPHYQEVCEIAKSYTLTPARLKKGAERFLECLAKSNGDWEAAGKMFGSAIDALAASDWHMGRDPKTGGKRYRDWLKNLCKTQEQFEEWIDA